ncbi:MAG: UDP-2,3-diacylglucosamine diphosphatase [Gammaproteobacteria bacterium]|nr:UDP-2,3-diacylglucosamine diphosphatase [Gammaproteobacteria bacterium]
MTTLFISDLHLAADHPDIGTQFLAFLHGEASRAESLYILGDMFETWVGDDDPNAYYAEMKAAIHALIGRGVPVFFMHGNRDFLIGERFAAETGITILPDPHQIDLYGTDVLLSHGDAMCIDDVAYQQFRTKTRDPKWQAAMLEKPLDERLAFAAQARLQSKQHYAMANKKIMDVNEGAVKETFAKYGADVLLHGHTHRPAVHKLAIGGLQATRIVLGDWYKQGSVLRWDAAGYSLDVLPRL